ncbi:hypothetical protein KEM60_02683 [Austwickia sp. TVS 96-490-7B]|uniref:DUF6308 family protein n=1 Tax=Austwickia sp. TVS 96-490-7B TaxID=2830843 RepID=UPI001C5785B5|nr:DUF6308 family protein [Austwickia sp. TVS 96-490-7B]MBW3086462.1 hypothetical protein [Austwickia sp. TVS 96-490-7B]
MANNRLPVPEGWRNADLYLEPALDRVWTALRDTRTPERLARYYSPDANFAGSTFLYHGESDPEDLTHEDLLAVTLLDVKIPPRTVRSLLESGPTRNRVLELLSADRLPLDAKLEEATPELLEAMVQLYEFLRGLVPPTRDRYEVNWATAAKICARKRPNLFPVRDEVVCRYLRLWPSRYQVDWQVFAWIMGHDDVRDQLEKLIRRTADVSGTDVGDPGTLLRHLDVAVWMHAPHRF